MLAELPTEWNARLCARASSGGTPSVVPLARRQATAKRILMGYTPGPIRESLRGLRYIIDFCAEQDMPVTASADVLAWALEEYQENARERAQARVDARAKAGLEPLRSNRMGATATEAVRLGLARLQTKLLLPIDADNAMIKAVAAAGPGMPSIRTMLPFDALLAFEHTSGDPASSEFERAYGGGGDTNNCRLKPQRSKG